jgi:hypothetical protein
MRTEPPRTRTFSLLAERHRGARARPRCSINAELGKAAAMSAPVIRGLAATIRGAVSDLTKLASDAAAELAAEVEGFKGDVADVKDVTKDVRAARADVRAALGQGTNGGPSLQGDGATPTSPAALPSATPSTPSSQNSAVLPNGKERTPIGVVQR